MRKSILALGLVLLIAAVAVNVLNRPKKLDKVNPRDSGRVIREAELGRIRKMIQRRADLNKRFRGQPALMVAIRYGDTELAKSLIENGADVNARSDFGAPALHECLYSCGTQNLTIAALLIAHGADVEGKRSDGSTLLMDAVYYHCVEGAELLITNGADVNAKDNNGLSVLLKAARDADPRAKKIEALLIQNGADVNVVDQDGRTALMYAAFEGNLEMAKLLIEHGANVNASDKDGLTALIAGTFFGSLEMVKLLVENGANTEAKNTKGMTALSYAQRHNLMYIVDFLKSRTFVSAKTNKQFSVQEEHRDSYDKGRLVVERYPPKIVTQDNPDFNTLMEFQRNIQNKGNATVSQFSAWYELSGSLLKLFPSYRFYRLSWHWASCGGLNKWQRRNMSCCAMSFVNATVAINQKTNETKIFEKIGTRYFEGNETIGNFLTQEKISIASEEQAVLVLDAINQIEPLRDGAILKINPHIWHLGVSVSFDPNGIHRRCFEVAVDGRSNVIEGKNLFGSYFAFLKGD